ncbi:hypothetical protein AAVH_20631 [Aphelenchoides avenae]|nr:hypothetical protein AAVH_20631 [Aphelenchus avenae]
MRLELLVVTARVLRGGRFEPVRISVPFGSLGQDVLKNLECSYVRLKKNEYILPRADGPLFVLQRLLDQGYVIASAALNGSWTLVKWADDGGYGCMERAVMPSSPLPSLSEFGHGVQNNGHGFDGLLFFQLSEASTSKGVGSSKGKSAAVVVEAVSKFTVERRIGLWLRHRQLFLAANTRTEIRVEKVDGTSSLVTIIGPQQVNSIIRMFIDALCTREFHVSSAKATWLCKTANGAKRARIEEIKVKLRSIGGSTFPFPINACTRLQFMGFSFFGAPQGTSPARAL